MLVMQTCSVQSSASQNVEQHTSINPSNGNFFITMPNSQLQTKEFFNQLVKHLIDNSCLTNRGGSGFTTNQEIEDTFKQLIEIISNEYSSEDKRSNMILIVQNAQTIFTHLFLLNNGYLSTDLLNQQIGVILNALQQTTKFSHDQFYGHTVALENRKFLISLGLVDALTEIFILDIKIFGLKLNSYEKCLKLRRSIGNALMNLVYHQKDAKIRLCANSQFLCRVAEVIWKIQPLVQFYAGLIQNVSYNADQQIAHRLAITVPPLIHTAISIVYDQENQRKFELSVLSSNRKQQLLKILSALWNLAEDPIENKRVMCHDVPQFVPMLLHIMCGDQHDFQFIQAATGIMKHLCSYILKYDELFARTVKRGILNAFMRQLESSSADLVTDSLAALTILSKHPVIAQKIMSQHVYTQEILYLIQSTNENIARSSRALLDTIYSTVHYQINPSPQQGMCNSMVSWPIKQHEQVQSTFPRQFVSQNPQFFTLPRATQQTIGPGQKCFKQHEPIVKPNTLLPLNKQNSPKSQKELDELDRRKNCQYDDEAKETQFLMEDTLLSEHDLPTSVQCTRDVSPQTRNSSFNSINDMKIGQEWPSVQSTSVQNSGIHSPASPSDLPDSPSQCATHAAFQLKEMEFQILHALNENKQSGQCTNANVSGDADADTESQTVDMSSVNVKNVDLVNEEIHGDEGGNLLAEVIRDYMPKPSDFNSNMTADYNFTRTSTPNPTSSSPSKFLHGDKANGHGAKGKELNTCLLNESIAAVMPTPGKKQFFVGKEVSTNLFDVTNSNCSKASSSDRGELHNNCEDDIISNAQPQDRRISTKIPFDIGKDIDTQWINVDCRKISQTVQPSGSVERNSSSRLMSGMSHIPVIPTREKKKSSIKNGKLYSPKDIEMKSPQKIEKPSRFRNGSNCNRNAPPLAPKPKFLLPRPQHKLDTHTTTAEEKCKIVTL